MPTLEKIFSTGTLRVLRLIRIGVVLKCCVSELAFIRWHWSCRSRKLFCSEVLLPKCYFSGDTGKRKDSNETAPLSGIFQFRPHREERSISAAKNFPRCNYDADICRVQEEEAEQLRTIHDFVEECENHFKPTIFANPQSYPAFRVVLLPIRYFWSAWPTYGQFYLPLLTWLPLDKFN